MDIWHDKGWGWPREFEVIFSLYNITPTHLNIVKNLKR